MSDCIDRIYNHAANFIDGCIANNHAWLKNHCESAIEVTLGLAIVTFDLLIRPDPERSLALATQDENWPSHTRLLIPQFRYGSKRVDFLYRNDPGYEVFLECDGHDFHERTKEQAARDRQKDRLLQHSAPILRFTGSEIWRDPMGCADEVINFVCGLYHDDEAIQ